MNSTFVSVVMCTYNGSKYLDEQVRSILKQDYENLELIVVDDCSEDDTWNKLETWQKTDKRVQVYKNNYNLGYNKNFQKAISLASGDLIALSDQDDIWLPQKISRLAAAFDDKKVVLAHNRSVRLENGRLRFKSASLHSHFEGNDTRKLFMFNQVNGHDIMFRRKLRNKFLPIPEGMMYDWWIAVKATCYGTIASVDEYLVHHRIHADNSFFSAKKTVKKTEPDLEEALRIFSKIDELSNESHNFLQTFIELLSSHNKKEKIIFDYSLFRFLFKYRKIIFGRKLRFFQEFSYLKFAIKYAKAEYKGKGLSF